MSADEPIPEVEGESEEQKVLLQKEKIKAGLSSIQRSSNRRNFAYVSLNLIGQSISTLEGDLKDYQELKYLDFTHNDITDISPLSELTNTLSINLQKNQLPSYEGLQRCSQLQVLRLDNNSINALSNVEFPALRAMTLSKNQIVSLGDDTKLGAVYPQLQILDLSFNQIKSIQGLGHFPLLSAVNLRGNLIESLNGIQDCKQLTKLTLSENNLPWDEIAQLTKLPKLVELDIARNPPISEQYADELELLRESLILLGALDKFNGEAITQFQRIEAHQLKLERLAEAEAARREKEAEEEAAKREAEGDTEKDGSTADSYDDDEDE